MPRPSIVPVPDSAMLRVAPASGSAFAIVADVHLGLGGGPDLPRGPPGADAAEMANELCTTARKARVRRLVIAGDAKHPIVGTPRWLRPVIFDFFSTLVSDGLQVEVIAGNHDVGIAPSLPREVAWTGSNGAVRGGIGVFHGHCWPSIAVLNTPVLVVGHLHPGVRLAATAEEQRVKLRCWVRARRQRPVEEGRGGPRRRAIKSEEIVVLPAFNPITGTEALNRERPARGRSFLFHRFLSDSELRAYLLDGTDLGALIPPLRSVPRSRAARAR